MCDHPDLCINYTIAVLHYFKFQGIFDTKKLNQHIVVSSPSGYVCNQVCQNNRVTSAIEVYLGLNLVEHLADLSVVIEPANEDST